MKNYKILKMLWSSDELKSALKEQIIKYNLDDNLKVNQVVIDSRQKVRNGLFIAIKGPNHDAHNFLNQAQENGNNCLIIDNESTIKNIKNCNFILVKNSLESLNLLAKFARQRSKAKIIGITGSVGKTTAKEMLKCAFDQYGKVFATKGNLNNHIGVPLSLVNFEKDCDFGIFEMGMNHSGEITKLSQLVKPDLAIITTVAPVHLEFFANEQEIARAKSEIFAGLNENGKILLNRDNIHFNFLKNLAKNPIFSFGSHKDSNFCLKSSKINQNNQLELEVITKNWQHFNYEVINSNKATIYNSLIVVGALNLLNLDAKIGLDNLKNLENAQGRGQIYKVNFDNKNITIIDDSYNASLPAIKSGLEYISDLKQQFNHKRTIAALGDMLELGSKSLELHQEIATYLTKFKIDFSILVGDTMPLIANNLDKNQYISFTNSSIAASNLKNLLQDGDLLYVKGSRALKMEKLVKILTKN